MPDEKKHRSYGRQKDSNTIKSLSLDKKLVDLLEAEALRRGVSFSALVSELLSDEIIPAPTSRSGGEERD